MWDGRGGSPGRLIGFIYMLRAGCSSHTRRQPCLASWSSSPGPQVASRTMRQSRRVDWMKEHLEVMALEGAPSNVYGGFTRSVCVQCRPQWGRVQWWGGLTTQALRVGRESSYVQQGKERERESASCVERATCQALWPQRGSECPDHTPAPLPPALLPGSPIGHSQQVTEGMGAW